MPWHPDVAALLEAISQLGRPVTIPGELAFFDATDMHRDVEELAETLGWWTTREVPCHYIRSLRAKASKLTDGRIDLQLRRYPGGVTAGSPFRIAMELDRKGVEVKSVEKLLSFDDADLRIIVVGFPGHPRWIGEHRRILVIGTGRKSSDR